MKIMGCIVILAAILLTGMTVSSTLASGKPPNHGNSPAAAAYPATASTVSYTASAGAEPGKAVFKSHGACVRFFARNRGDKIVSTSSTTTTGSVMPSANPAVHSNSQAAKLCPSTGGMAFYKNASGTIAGMQTFKTHGTCVSFFARNRNLSIVTA